MDKDYLRRKLAGCFLGRAAGETLGRPYQGSQEPLNLLFYDPEPPAGFSRCLLDFQTMWVRLLLSLPGAPLVERDFFTQSWLDHVSLAEEEYGIALRNLKNNITPPWSGSFDNFYSESIGAARRANLWAALAPAKTDLAVQFAYEDACVDHDGDGIHAAMFTAALESLAYIENNMDVLLDSACSYLPEDSRLLAVVNDARELCAAEKDWEAVRKTLLSKYDCENCSDSVMNFGFIITALLLGEGDFERSVLIAANCAKDVVANASLTGEILGLLNPDSIPEKWLNPISHELQLSEFIQGIEPFDTLESFIDAVIRLGETVGLGEPVVSDAPDMEQYLIPVDIGISHRWLRWNERLSLPDLDCMTARFTFPGCFNYLDAYEIPPNSMYMMKFHFTIEEPKRIRVIFNCSAISRVWLDGVFAFGRDGGWLSPSYSTVPLNQYADVEVEAGIHTLVAGVAPNQPGENIYWVMGVANCSDKHWLPYAFFNAAVAEN